MKRLQHAIGRETFMVTYGDGVGNVDLGALLSSTAHGKLATVTAVRPAGALRRPRVRWRHGGEFTEKPQIGEGWINGGFLVFEPEILDYLVEDGSQPGGRISWNGSRAKASSRHIATMASGSAWIRSETCGSSSRCGSGGAPPWKVWR